MKKFVFLLFASAVSVSALAQNSAGGRWVQIKNVSTIRCQFHGYTGFMVIDDSKQAARFGRNAILTIQNGSGQVSMSRNEPLEIMAERCNAAIYQARNDGTGIMINIDTGETKPENGFFTRISE